MKGLPAGMFQPGNSLIHNMDAGVKITALFLLLASVVNTTTIPGYAGMLIFAALLIKLSGVDMRSALASVSRLMWFFILIMLMNICFYGPDDPWISWWILNPSYHGLMQGLNVVLRVFLLLLFSNILTITTAPVEMTKAIARLLAPLRIFRIPAEQVAMILSVAIQFIPTLFEETENIRKAQTARGARFDSPKLTERAKAVMPLAIPVFLAAFKRADELSLAMEARGYRTEKRQMPAEHIKLGKTDCAALLLCTVMCVLYIVIR